jgi:hypothetical protein
MSTRTDWGWFKADGAPIAVGDEWHKWVCPQRKWVSVGYEHDWTGEWVDEGLALEPGCPTRSTGPKREVCDRCGNVFIYP